VKLLIGTWLVGPGRRCDLAVKSGGARAVPLLARRTPPALRELYRRPTRLTLAEEH